MNRYKVTVRLTCEHDLIAEIDAPNREEAINQAQEMADEDQSGIEVRGWPDCEWVSEEREILEYGVKSVGKTVDIKRRNITEKMRRLQKQLENLNGTADI